MTVIETDKLQKQYSGVRGSFMAVDSLDLNIPGPGVYGFLGPNGSGKTTTIRCLLGLVRPTGGTARLFGEDVTNSLPKVINRVGALVESPKFFPTFSGRKNLNLFGRVAGISSQRVDEVLESVDMAGPANDRFASYSLGMKQRLAVAATLLKDPDLLILDEPANGLDPAGIVDIRLLIRRLGESGKTVFVSSHQLAEVQQTCDWAAIISRGRLLRTGTMAELAAGGRPAQLVVTIDDAPGAIEVLVAAGFDATAGSEVDTIEVAGQPEDGARITHILADRGRYLRAMSAVPDNLESTFLEITADGGVR